MILQFCLMTYLLMACHAMTLYLMSDVKPMFRHPAALYVSFFALSCSVLTAVAVAYDGDNTLGVLFAISIGLHCVFFLSVTDGMILKNIFLFMVYSTYFILAVGWSQYISAVLFDGSYMATFIIRSILSISYIILLAARLRNYLIAFTEDVDSGWGPICTFSSVSCILVSYEVMYSPEEMGLVQLLTISVIITSAFIVGFQTIMHLYEEGRLQEMETRKDLLIQELESENEAMEYARRLRHDIRHHNAVMLEYLEDGDVQGAKEYLDTFSSKAESCPLPRCWCENKAANAVIRAAARRSAASGVSFAFEGSIPVHLPLSEPEIACVLGNVLENAVHAAEGIRSGSVSIRSIDKGNALFLEVSNTSKGPVPFADGLPRSGRAGGGLGLRNVRSILDSHGAMIRFTQDDDVFVAQLVIPM